MGKGLFAAAVFAGVGLAAGAALAGTTDNYDVTTASGLYVAPPSGANPTGLGNQQIKAFALPFDFVYYGRSCDTAFVCTNGFLQLGYVASGATNGNHELPLASVSYLQGSVFVAGKAYRPAVAGSIVHWTDGEAPSRRFIVSWEGLPDNYSTTTRHTFQVQLHEGTGRVVFAYGPVQDSSWGSGNYTIGMDAPTTDERYVIPPGTSNNQNLYHPGQDFVFDPQVTDLTGTVLYDHPVADATGLGNSQALGAAPETARIEVRTQGAIPVGLGAVGPDGTFTAEALALGETDPFDLVLVTASGACRVLRTATEEPQRLTLAAAVKYQYGTALGAFTVDDAVDADLAVRSALHVASRLGVAHAWAERWTGETVPPLDVLLDPASDLPTAYSPATGTSAASLRVASDGAVNPDSWDAAVCVRAYGRHLLGSLAAFPGAAIDGRYDAVTTEADAFAEAFGVYVYAASHGSSQYVDSLTSDTALVLDLETPELVTAPGPAVAGWVAAALFDLVDGANEAHDLHDGSAESGAAAGRAAAVAAGMTVPPTAAGLHAAWGDAGHEGAALTRSFVHHGLLADDGHEPNETLDELRALPGVPLSTPLVLNRYGEDWFETVLDESTLNLYVDVAFDDVAQPARVALEVHDPTGRIVAGTELGSPGTVRADLGPSEPGTYRIRVRHASGARIASYDLSALARMRVDLPQGFRATTQGRTYEFALPVVGGLPPHSAELSASSGPLPSGLFLDRTGLRIYGTPTEPGDAPLSVRVADSAHPQSAHVVSGVLRVNERLRLELEEFVGFPAGRVVDWTGPRRGGTAPFDVELVSGTLPPGLSLAADELRFTGVAAGPATALLSLRARDDAGDEDAVTTTAVVSLPLADGAATLDLEGGEAAAGVWFDAVAGSTADLRVKTGRKLPRRALRAVVLDPSGRAVAGGKRKLRSGSASLGGVPCATSGRYHLVLASEAGEATQLVVRVGAAAPRGAAGRLRPDSAFPGTEAVTFGALPGAKLTVTAKAAKKPVAPPRIVALLGPDGTPVPILGLVKPSKSSARLDVTLQSGGTWTLLLGAAQGQSAENVSYKLRLRQPKGAAWSAD